MEFLYAIGSDKDWSFFLLRFALGLIFFYHGMPRLSRPASFAERSGAPGFAPLILLFGVIEVFSGLMLIFGVYERIAAFFLLAAIVFATFIRGFQKRPQFSLDGVTTWEFEMLFAASCFIILLNGGGAISILRFLGFWVV